MKLQAAFKFSALTLALASTHSIAAVTQTVDTSGNLVAYEVAIDNLPAGSNSTLTVDASGTNVNAGTTAIVDNESLTGTTLSYATVVDPAVVTTPQTHSYTDTFEGTSTTDTTAQIYTPEKLQFDSKTVEETYTRTEGKNANVNYDATGRFVGIDNVVSTGAPVTVSNGSQVISEDTIIVGRENTGDANALTVRKTDATGTTETVVTAGSVTTDTINANSLNVTDFNTTNLTADTITLGGKDLAQTIADGDAATLATARTELAAGDAATLTSANAYTNTAVSNITNTANAYTDVQVAGVNSRVDQLNKRVDDVEQTSYRGIAIALAAQQQIPNIGAGQFAVFGGVGHYEGESAAALGLASVLADGRTAFSAALGVAGGSEIGGRVGVSYVFGGK